MCARRSDLAVVTNVYGDNRTHLLIGASTEYVRSCADGATSAALSGRSYLGGMSRTLQTADYWFAGAVRTVDVSGLVGAVSIEDVDVRAGGRRRRRRRRRACVEDEGRGTV